MKERPKTQLFKGNTQLGNETASKKRARDGQPRTEGQSRLSDDWPRKLQVLPRTREAEERNDSSLDLTGPSPHEASTINVSADPPDKYYDDIHQIHDFYGVIKCAVSKTDNADIVHIREISVADGEGALQNYTYLTHKNIVQAKVIYSPGDSYFVVLEETKFCLSQVCRCPGILNNEQMKCILAQVHRGFFDYSFTQHEPSITTIQIVEALLYLAEQGMVHGQLALDNIFITSRGCVKLGEPRIALEYERVYSLHFTYIGKQECFRSWDIVTARADVSALQRIMFQLSGEVQAVTDVERIGQKFRQAYLLALDTELEDAPSITALKNRKSWLTGFSSLSALVAKTNLTVQQNYTLLEKQ